MLFQCGVEELDRPVQSPDLNPLQHLQEELENLIESLLSRVEIVIAAQELAAFFAAMIICQLWLKCWSVHIFYAVGTS